ncbi:hypothetical protein U4T63_18255 [Klebsiella pneumoniae]
MGNINEKEQWEDNIPLITRSQKVEGGMTGAANSQSIPLANRTRYLKLVAGSALKIAEQVRTAINSLHADPVNAVTSIIIPAKDFDLASGNATYGMVAQRIAGWQLSHGAKSSITKVINLPSHWEGMRISLIWSNLIANDGNVSFSGEVHGWAEGESFNKPPAGYSTVAVANATPYMGIETELALNLPVDPARNTTIRITRNGDSVNDTLATAMVLLAVRLSKVDV